MGLGEGTENIDEEVRKSVLKALNKMRDGLWQQRDRIVKQEGLAEIIQVVTNTPIRSLRPVSESLASARPSSSSQAASSEDTPSSSACPPAPELSTTPACPSSSTDTSTSLDPPTPVHPVTPLEVPIVSSLEGLSVDSPQWRPICMYVGANHKYKCPEKIVDTSCPQLMQSKGIKDRFTQMRHMAHTQTDNSHATILNLTLSILLHALHHNNIVKYC